MTDTDNFDPQEVETILREFLPLYFYEMISKNLIDLDRLNDKSYLWQILKDNIGKIDTSEMKFIVQIHSGFIKAAKNSLDIGEKPSSIILIATAIEHVFNNYYRSVLTYKGLTESQITDILRKSNIEAKFGWLMSVTGKVILSDDLIGEIREIFELRNSLVHYKAIPQFFETYTGGWTDIESRIDKFDFEKLFDLPIVLETKLTKSLEKRRYNKIIKQIIHTMFDE